MKEIKRLLFVLIVLLIGFEAHSQVSVDGIFDDWKDIDAIYVDELGDGGFSGIDIGEVKVKNDQQFLFFYFQIGREINIQDLNELTLFVDTDNDPSTGRAIHGIGADLEYVFGRREGYFSGPGVFRTLEHADIGLVTAPTVTSTEFEIALDLDTQIGGRRLFLTEDIKFSLSDPNFNGDQAPEVDGGLPFKIIADAFSSRASYSISKPADTEFRVVSYNALFDNIFDFARQDEFKRILSALDPEIIGFQEIYDHSSLEVAQLIEDFLPSETGEKWYHSKRGPDVHCISRYPITASFNLPGVNGSQGNGAFVLDIPFSDQPMLFMNLHTPCCSNDEGREDEFDGMMKFLRDAQEGISGPDLPEGSPVIIVGDMNMVGKARQIRTLVEGDIVREDIYGPDFNPDWDGTSLEDAMPPTTDLPMNYTWYRPQSDFGPGRLDFIVYTGSVLVDLNSFSLASFALSNETLDTYGLRRNDTSTASDHLPVVVDFKMKREVATQEHDRIKDFVVAPNPISDYFETEFLLKVSETISIDVIDVNGRSISQLFNGPLSQGKHKLSHNLSGLVSGNYFIRLKTKKGSSQTNIIKL